MKNASVYPHLSGLEWLMGRNLKQRCPRGRVRCAAWSAKAAACRPFRSFSSGWLFS